jgi:hypothetical protein
VLGGGILTIDRISNKIRTYGQVDLLSPLFGRLGICFFFFLECFYFLYAISSASHMLVRWLWQAEQGGANERAAALLP